MPGFEGIGLSSVSTDALRMSKHYAGDKRRQKPINTGLFGIKDQRQRTTTDDASAMEYPANR
jgi:hypothetical protein